MKSQQKSSSQQNKRPEFVNGIRVRMPEDYDFHNWGKDYSSYSRDFSLRTDAVWQKQQLRDWFRLTNKYFWFNYSEAKYENIQPEDVYTNLYESQGLQQNDDLCDYDGFSKTGVTAAFQYGIGPRQRVQNTFNSFYSMPDYYMMCAMRFERWFRCDQAHSQDKYQPSGIGNPKTGLTNMKKQDHYPCFREYYQADYACVDRNMQILLELAYLKKAQDFFQGDFSNAQITSVGTVYDSPSAPERITLTY